MHYFTDHPRSVKESYCQHFTFACKTGAKLCMYSIVSVIHGVFPFLFETFVSDHIIDLADDMNERRYFKQE